MCLWCALCGVFLWTHWDGRTPPQKNFHHTNKFFYRHSHEGFPAQYLAETERTRCQASLAHLHLLGLIECYPFKRVGVLLILFCQPRPEQEDMNSTGNQQGAYQ